MTARHHPLSPRAILLGVALALTQLTCQAHGMDNEPSDDGSWGVGLIGIAKKKPYKNFDNKVEAWPMVTYENRWVRVFGPGVDVKLGKTGQFSYALTATYAHDGYKSSDSSYLAGMAERKASFWVGGKVTWAGEIANVSATWQGDASGNSKGQKFTLGADHRFNLGKFSLTPRAVVLWQDRKFVDYYYGVSAAEAANGRQAYKGSATASTELGVRLDYPLAPGQTAFVDVGTTLLGSAIKNSSLVERSTMPEVRLGYIYRF